MSYAQNDDLLNQHNDDGTETDSTDAKPKKKGKKKSKKKSKTETKSQTSTSKTKRKTNSTSSSSSRIAKARRTRSRLSDISNSSNDDNNNNKVPQLKYDTQYHIVDGLLKDDLVERGWQLYQQMCTLPADDENRLRKGSEFKNSDWYRWWLTAVLNKFHNKTNKTNKINEKINDLVNPTFMVGFKEGNEKQSQYTKWKLYQHLGSDYRRPLGMFTYIYIVYIYIYIYIYIYL